MSIKVTELRADLYRIVDRVIETGIPVEIDRNGVKVMLVAERKKTKLENLTAHPGTIVGDPEDIVHMDWSHEWKGKL
jgi:hypothetical protein